MNRHILRTTVDYFLTITHWGADLVFPIRCMGCGDYQNKYPYLCRTCFSSLVIRQTSECIGCKAPVTLGATCQLCKSTSSVDQLLIVSRYDQSLLEKVIAAWKYQFVYSCDLALFALMKKYLHQMHNRYRLNIFRDDPLIIPVPLSRRRLNWRGFNQAELIAQKLSKTFHIQIDTKKLQRIRHTLPQVLADDRETRLQNLRGSFQMLPGTYLTGRHIILIDDVCTTGATLNECARVLKENGAQYVSALVIARGT